MCMRVAMWGWVLVLVVSLPARAQQQQAAANESDQTLKRLSIEDLSSIDVTSTLKHAEPISGSAAAIEVITGDDIRRAGVTTLPEALRLADRRPGGALRRPHLGDHRPRLQHQHRQQAARDDRRAQRLHAALLRRLLGRPGSHPRGRRSDRGDSRPGRDAVGRQRRQRRDQHRHEARVADRRARWCRSAAEPISDRPASATGAGLAATAASASTASIVIAAARCSRPARARRIRCARARRASASIMARRGAR